MRGWTVWVRIPPWTRTTGSAATVGVVGRHAGFESCGRWETCPPGRRPAVPL